MRYQLEDLSKELQQRITELDTVVNNKEWYGNPDAVRYTLPFDFSHEIIQGTVSVLRQPTVYFKKVCEDEVIKYIFDYIE